MPALPFDQIGVVPGRVDVIDHDALVKLGAPVLRQVGDADAGVLDRMRQLETEQIRGHALIDGHLAVVDTQIVTGLAPQVADGRGPRQRRQQRDDAHDDQDPRTDHLGVRQLLLLVVLVVDRLGHVGVVGIGGKPPVALLHHGDLAGVRLLQVAGLLAHRGRLRGVRHRIGAGLLRQRRGTLRRRRFAAAQRRRGGHRLVDDVGDRFEAGAGRASDQRRLVRQVERVHIQGERGVGDHGGDVVGAARAQRHRHQLLGALALIGDRRERLLDRGILQHAAQAVRTQQPAVGRVGLPHRDVRPGVDVEITQHAHHHIALRMVARLRLGDAAGVDEVLHVAVVLRHPDQMPVT